MEDKVIQFTKAMITLELILGGALGIIEGCHQFLSSAYSSTIEHDDSFLTFVAVASESDHLPVGNVRKEWDTSALALKDKEISEFEAFYKDTIFRAATDLLIKYRVREPYP